MVRRFVFVQLLVLSINCSAFTFLDVQSWLVNRWKNGGSVPYLDWHHQIKQQIEHEVFARGFLYAKESCSYHDDTMWVVYRNQKHKKDTLVRCFYVQGNFVSFYDRAEQQRQERKQRRLEEKKNKSKN